MQTLREFYQKYFQDIKTRRERDHADWFVDGFLIIPPREYPRSANKTIKCKCRELIVFENSGALPHKLAVTYRKVKFCVKEIPDSIYTPEYLENLRNKKMPFEWDMALHSKMVGLAKRNVFF